MLVYFFTSPAAAPSAGFLCVFSYRDKRMQEATTATSDQIDTTASPVYVLGSQASQGLGSAVESLCGEIVTHCYQCGECTAGCPVAFAMDIMPNQVMRMAQLGLTKPLLESRAIWLCAGCETCATRCPRSVALSKVMDALRQIAQSEGKAAETNVVKFHKAFMDAVARDGRVHEVGMLARYKMATRDLFSDIGLGMRMFFKGKLKMMPDKIRGAREVRELIRKCQEAGK
jgi:heterodisulfide reductase subunit C2